MDNYCPFMNIGSTHRRAECITNCALYNDGCLIAKALNVYIENNSMSKNIQNLFDGFFGSHPYVKKSGDEE